MTIGDWVMREKLRVPHYVESVVAGDVITRCGKRMSDEPTKTGGGLTVIRVDGSGADMTGMGYGRRKCRLCNRNVAIQ